MTGSDFFTVTDLRADHLTLNLVEGRIWSKVCIFYEQAAKPFAVR